jgi:hypothetical protein
MHGNYLNNATAGIPLNDRLPQLIAKISPPGG